MTPHQIAIVLVNVTIAVLNFVMAVRNYRNAQDNQTLARALTVQIIILRLARQWRP